MIGEKREIFDLTLAAHYKPLYPYIAPNRTKDFPVIDLPISYLYYNANNTNHYISIMPKAHGKEFMNVINDYISLPDDLNKKKLKRAYSALGRTLGNFHRTFMRPNKNSLKGTTITHGDLHARNFFYDEDTDTIYWIDNERIGISTLTPQSIFNDLDWALFLPFQSDWLKLNKNIKNNPESWFETFYSDFFNSYLDAFGDNKKLHAQELKEILSRITDERLRKLSYKVIDKLT